MFESGCGPPDSVCGVSGEVRRHILVNELLQVESERVTSRTDYDISADAGVTRNIAARVSQLCPGRIVSVGDSHLCTCRTCEPLAHGQLSSDCWSRDERSGCQHPEKRSSVHQAHLANAIYSTRKSAHPWGGRST